MAWQYLFIGVLLFFAIVHIGRALRKASGGGDCGSGCSCGSGKVPERLGRRKDLIQLSIQDKPAQDDQQ